MINLLPLLQETSCKNNLNYSNQIKWNETKSLFINSTSEPTTKVPIFSFYKNKGACLHAYKVMFNKYNY